MSKRGSSYLYIADSDIALDFTWELTSQSGMTSVISYELRWRYEGTGKFVATSDFFLTINGSTNVSGLSITNAPAGGPSYVNTLIFSGTASIERSADTNLGTLNVKYGYGAGNWCYTDEQYDGYHNFGAYNNNPWWHIETTTVFGVPAQITYISDFDDEHPPTISYSYDKGTSVTSVTLEAAISFNGSSYNIPYREIPYPANTYTFNFTQAELETLWTLLNAGETATVRFYIKTTENVNGEISVKESFLPKTFTFVNYKPLIKPTIYDVNPATIAVTGNANNIVRYMSEVHYEMDVELRKGATDVVGSYIQNGDRIEEGFLEGTFSAPTSNTFYFSATDNRLYTGTTSLALSAFYGEFINYIKLTSSVKSTPITTDGDALITISGKCFNANFGAAQNSLRLSYSVHKQGEAAVWSTPEAIQYEMSDNTTYSYTFPVSNLDYTKQYVVEIKVNDLLMEATSKTYAIASPLFYWNNDKFIFNVPVIFNNGYSNGG